MERPIKDLVEFVTHNGRPDFVEQIVDLQRRGILLAERETTFVSTSDGTTVSLSSSGIRKINRRIITRGMAEGALEFVKIMLVNLFGVKDLNTGNCRDVMPQKLATIVDWLDSIPQFTGRYNKVLLLTRVQEFISNTNFA